MWGTPPVVLCVWHSENNQQSDAFTALNFLPCKIPLPMRCLFRSICHVHSTEEPWVARWSSVTKLTYVKLLGCPIRSCYYERTAGRSGSFFLDFTLLPILSLFSCQGHRGMGNGTVLSLSHVVYTAPSCSG